MYARSGIKSRPNHNLSSGFLQCCQICGSENLEQVLDLRNQPLCDSLLTAEQLKGPETFYPLCQLWCKDCTLSQLNYVVQGEVVYHQNYPYRTGVTRELVAYQQQMASELVHDLNLCNDDLVCDIGSNDGTLLSAFKAKQMRVMGIEPTNIAHIANQEGIETVHSPFNQEIATQIVKTIGHAKLVTATNVFAHMASLGDVIEGLEILVADDGFFVLENHYLIPVMERLQFDTIYHEHLRTYSLRSLITLFSYYNFTVVDAKEVSRYGGNIRVYVAKGKNHTPKASVNELLAKEERTGLSNPDYYRQFGQKSINLKNQLLEFIVQCNQKNLSIVGNSCPGRCSTLLNFAGIGPDLLPYLGEQPTSLKLNKYLPGTHIPIVNNQRLIDEQPEYVIILAWHYAEPIMEQLRARGLRSKFILPMPEFKIIE
ncbi:class I SAM-dependent methyltransferase [Legionella longbeachae]|uniref:Putative methyltransferase n=1 Tax=Legionella longbeachae serogroup 1 (strain NSW150) TaxID=661367 RepID=D3HNT9_LEGLN|nr:class I SAM-dependent methyltransferase [Legionella longbeachae]VEE01078.1 methyltransferase [Legionella oakridgensis]HBD7398480.1 class I SAM-dependent methyltransferase [Legionella pneumophila]ARB92541.1 class I SAM-dependent methyltransferase [Legionella longbeachae]ARM34283.1 class I SAM-dependent methyltransferase [Legionella longbeachae]EEZ96452.1 putative methyltransferase [Legionella longbeachae D-4968]